MLSLNLYYMKRLLTLIFAGLLLLSFNSCIVLSTKKYNSLLASSDSLSAGWNEAQLKIGNLEGLISNLRADTARLNNRIAGLQTDIEKMNADYKALNATYSSLRSNSSSEINKLPKILKDVRRD